MRIAKLKAQNYRTLEEFELSFPSFYSAICGKNDSGKTNIVRLIRSLMKEEDPFFYVGPEEITIKEDFTKWKEVPSKSRELIVRLDIVINKIRDAGLHEFVSTYLALSDYDENITLSVEVLVPSESPRSISVFVGDQTFTDLKAQEVLKKLQSSRIVLFHNSTETRPRYYKSSSTGSLRDFSEDFAKEVEAIQKTVDRGLKKIAKAQQKDIVELLGRLDEKYKVGLRLPSYDLSYLPFDLTLGDKKIDISIEDWGSGTRNRTFILLTLFRAKQISESTTSASKITPIIVIEEPESFLHPSAQAQFGKVLQDLAEEFKVQVITTTHSPYMLSQDNPESNILLSRKVEKNQLRETEHINTSGDNWMYPFGLALGIDNTEFTPWKEVFFSKHQSILLVEGDIDKEYFTLLKSPEHGDNKLPDDIEIFPYGGIGNLCKGILLRFLKNRYPNIFITYDLDVEPQVKEPLESLGFVKKKDHLPIGVNLPGKKNIEGLLPDRILQKVYQSHPDLVQQAMNGTTDEKKTANQKIKRFCLEEFKDSSSPGEEYFGQLYKIVSLVNKAFKSS